MIALGILACAAPAAALHSVGLVRPATRLATSRVRIRMEDAAKPEPAIPSEEVDRIYSAEVDAVLARLTATPYKPEEERYIWGFVPFAEKINGRFAMMGFFILLIIESVLGKVSTARLTA